MKKQKISVTIPDKGQIEAERARIHHSSRYRYAFKSTVATLLVVAAVAVLIATLLMPFLRIYGTSMTPTLENGEVIACIKTTEFKTGEIIAFYYNNKILVKRVIGHAGDLIDLKEDGSVYVNGEQLQEPYLTEQALGECDLDFPYQVPESALFVMGDHRATSIDSRSSAVGCVTEEQIVGKAIVRVWPLSHISMIK